jgi:hypothetical protein
MKTHAYTRASAQDKDCARWLDSSLFSGGVNQAANTYAALTCEEDSPEALLLDTLKQPLIGVRLSPHLDLLERAVMAALLHHMRALPHVLVAAESRQSNMQGVCDMVSVAARDMRKLVMQMCDTDNMALKDGEEPKEWTAYTGPLVERCKFLLKICVVCEGDDKGGDVQAGESEAKNIITMVREYVVAACVRAFEKKHESVLFLPD